MIGPNTDYNVENMDWYIDVRRVYKDRAQTFGIERDMQMFYRLIRNYEQKDYQYDLSKGISFCQQSFNYISNGISKLGRKLSCVKSTDHHFNHNKFVILTEP